MTAWGRATRQQAALAVAVLRRGARTTGFSLCVVTVRWLGVGCVLSGAYCCCCVAGNRFSELPASMLFSSLHQYPSQGVSDLS